MRFNSQINFGKIACILTQAAQGFSAITGCNLIVSDMVYSLADLSMNIHSGGLKEPYFIAIREMGTESGNKEHCLDRCKGLGYPLLIAKIERDRVIDMNMTIMLTHNWMNGDNNYMEQEFNSL